MHSLRRENVFLKIVSFTPRVRSHAGLAVGFQGLGTLLSEPEGRSEKAAIRDRACFLRKHLKFGMQVML